MIELQNINKSYGNLKVLSDINLSIGNNEIITILGPSGAGKTTLLQIAGTLDAPDSGKVIYDGEDITRFKDSKLSRYRNLNIGFIFQFHQLLPEFTARENVALPAMIAGMSKGKALKKASELLDVVGLSERENHKPSEMSGGERQRTAIARALINNPKVVFADEPTGSLDTQNRDEIYALIASLKEQFGITFVIVTHDLTIIEFADRIIHMEDGKIIPPEAEAASHIFETESCLPDSGSDLSDPSESCLPDSGSNLSNSSDFINFENNN